MRIALLEVKKIMTSRFHLILLMLFVCLPIVVFHNTMSFQVDADFMERQPYVHSDGSVISEAEKEAIIHQVKQEWTGEMDEAWWQSFQKAYQETIEADSIRTWDSEKMEEMYGKDWYADYQKHPEIYVYDAKNKQKGQRLIYEKGKPNAKTKEDLKSETMFDIYLYANILVRYQPWQKETARSHFMMSLDGKPAELENVYAKTPRTKAEFHLLHQKLEQQKPFHYGDSKHASDLISSYSTVGVLSALWVMIIASGIISKERKGNMLELLHTCTKGRGSLFWAKLLGVCIASLCGMLVIFAVVTIYAYACGYIGDMAVNSSETIYGVALYTYGQAFWISIECLILGTLVCAIISAFLSTYLKSSYVTLGILVGTFMLTTELGSSLPLLELVPSGFMPTPSVVFFGYTYSLFHHAFMKTQLLPMLWIPICILLSYGAYRHFISKKYSC